MSIIHEYRSLESRHAAADEALEAQRLGSRRVAPVRMRDRSERVAWPAPECTIVIDVCAEALIDRVIR